MRPGEALELCARSGGWYESSRERLEEFTGWLARTPAYALSYGDTAGAVAAVRRLLAARARDQNAAVHLVVPADRLLAEPAPVPPDLARVADPATPWPRLVTLSGVHMMTPAMAAALAVRHSPRHCPTSCGPI